MQKETIETKVTDFPKRSELECSSQKHEERKSMQEPDTVNQILRDYLINCYCDNMYIIINGNLLTVIFDSIDTIKNLCVFIT